MRRLLLGAASGLVVFAVQSALAQSANTGSTAAADEDTLQEVVVTAEKRPEDLQKTAISIQAVSGDELKKEGKKRLDEIMDEVVGVQAQGSQVGETFFMRGLGGGGGAPGGSPSSTAVAVIIDGIYQDRSETVRGGTLDMSQAEVMRGTQSTNLGASSLAGAVSLVSNQPVFTYQASGDLEVGNYHLMDTEGMLNVPLSDNQAIRFAYSTDNRNGYLSSGAGDSDLQNARLKYRWQVNEDLNIVLTGSHEHIGGNGVSDGVELYTGHWAPYSATVAAASGSNAVGTYIVSNGPGGATALTMGYPPIFGAVVDGITYKNRSNPWDDGYPDNIWPNSPYRDSVIDTYSSDINYKLPIGTLTITPSVEEASFRSEEPPRGGSYREQDQQQHTQQLDVRLASNTDSKLTWLLGAYYYFTNVPGTFLGVGLPGNSGGQGPTSLCSAHTSVYDYCWQDITGSWKRTYSAYGNFTYPILDTLRAIGGVRYSRDTGGYATSNSVEGNQGTPLSAYTFYYGRGEWSDTTFRIGLEYDVAPQSMAYATFSTGYQPGTVSLNGTVPLVNPKQTLDQYTLGIKNRFFNDTVQVNLEAFYSIYHNQTLQGNLAVGINGDDPSTDQNCGAAMGSSFGSDADCVTVANVIVPTLTSRGVDAEFAWLPTPNDRFDLSAEFLQSIIGTPAVTLTQTEINSLSPGLYSGLLATAKEYNGLTLQNSPKWSLNGTYQHTFRLPGGSELIPKVNGIYKTRYWTQGGAPGADIANTSGPAWQGAYSLWNVYTTWQSKDGKFSATAYMKNISDFPVMTNYGGTYVTLDAPRTWGLILQASL